MSEKDNDKLESRRGIAFNKKQIELIKKLTELTGMSQSQIIRAGVLALAKEYKLL